MLGALKRYWDRYGQATQLVLVFTVTVLYPATKVFTYPEDGIFMYVIWWLTALNGIAITGVGLRNLIHMEAKRALLKMLAQAARNLPPHPGPYSPGV